MKIQIDTSAKTIKLEGSVKLQELYEFMRNMQPDMWAEYSIDAAPIINWERPITIPCTSITPHYPYDGTGRQWWEMPTIVSIVQTWANNELDAATIATIDRQVVRDFMRYGIGEAHYPIATNILNLEIN